MALLTLRQFTTRSASALVALGLACLFSGHSAAMEASPSATPGVSIPKGQIDKAVGELDRLAAEMMQRSGVPGMAVAVVQDGKVAYAKGFGLRRVGSPEPVDADTVFQLASLSKSLAATVVAQQVGAGVVKWDTPLVEHLPWFKLEDPWISTHVTIADMFSHRSGLPDHAGDDLEDLGYGRRQVMERLKLLPLEGFRDVYAYTNFGLTAAAEAVAVASGRTWEDLAAEVLYKPLGMISASSRFEDFESRPNRVQGHVKTEAGFVPHTLRQPNAQSPAGGVSGSVTDVARWMTMILQGGRFEGREIIPEDALLPAMRAEMISDPSPTAATRPGFYGYGMNVGVSPAGRIVISHSGAFSMGAGTFYALIPSAGVGIAVLTNAAPTGAAEALGNEFNDLVQFGAVTRDWYPPYAAFMKALNAPAGGLSGKEPPKDAQPAGALGDYTGPYNNDYFGPATIEEKDGQLTLAIGPAGLRYRLRHWSGDRFAFSPASENQTAGSVAELTFTRDGSGRADAFTIDYLNGNGFGTFLR